MSSPARTAHAARAYTWKSVLGVSWKRGPDFGHHPERDDHQREQDEPDPLPPIQAGGPGDRGGRNRHCKTLSDGQPRPRSTDRRARRPARRPGTAFGLRHRRSFAGGKRGIRPGALYRGKLGKQGDLSRSVGAQSWSGSPTSSSSRSGCMATARPWSFITTAQLPSPASRRYSASGGPAAATVVRRRTASAASRRSRFAARRAVRRGGGWPRPSPGRRPAGTT